MEINNFDLIINHLHFDSDDDFYFLQILQRPKDGHNLRGNNTNRLIKYYIITSREQFKKYELEIIDICKLFNARAYIHPTKRSFKDVAKVHMKNVFENYANENYKNSGKEYSTACEQSWNSGNKRYVIDVDTTITPELYNTYCELLDKCEPLGVKKVDYVIPTLAGFHLICIPFNTLKFSQDLMINKLSADIHKNNPTLLYYNKP